MLEFHVAILTETQESEISYLILKVNTESHLHKNTHLKLEVAIAQHMSARWSHP